VLYTVKNGNHLSCHQLEIQYVTDKTGQENFWNSRIPGIYLSSSETTNYNVEVFLTRSGKPSLAHGSGI
jgi:hypothetical protein